MGWFRRVASELGLGLSLFGASMFGIDPREMTRGRGVDDTPSSSGAAGPVGCGPVGPDGADLVRQPPPGHPERLVPHVPLSDEERRLWSQMR